MAVVSFTIAPTQAQSAAGPSGFVFPTGITNSKIDTVKFTELMWLVKCMFAPSGVITTPGDTVTMTVTIDGTTT